MDSANIANPERTLSCLLRYREGLALQIVGQRFTTEPCLHRVRDTPPSEAGGGELQPCPLHKARHGSVAVELRLNVLRTLLRSASDTLEKAFLVSTCHLRDSRNGRAVSAELLTPTRSNVERFC